MGNKVIQPDYFTKGTIDAKDFCMVLDIPLAEGKYIKNKIKNYGRKGFTYSSFNAWKGY